MHNKQRTCTKVIAVILCLLLLVVLSLAFFTTPILTYLYKDFKAPSPVVYSTWASNGDWMVKGDVYVSKSGSDANDGTEQNPFLTIERALNAVEQIDRTKKSEIIVCIEGGTYPVNSLELLEKHGGTKDCRIIYTAYGEGEVVLNSGINIAPNDFDASREYPEIEKRLSPSARENVYIVD